MADGGWKNVDDKMRMEMRMEKYEWKNADGKMWMTK